MTQTLAAPPAPLTYDEFLEHYDGVHAEWVNGEVQPMSPVSNRHQIVGNFLFHLLDLYVQMRGLGQVRYAEFQMRLASQRVGREPDILFLKTENLARLRPNFVNGPADLVVEIVSPESAKRDYEDKFREYEAGGVSEYWLLDPLADTAFFYQLGPAGHYEPAAPGRDGRYESRAIDGLWVRPEWFRADPPPPVLEVLRGWGLL